MRVQQVLMPDGSESWTVLGDDGPVPPVERFLTHLHALDRFPTTQRTYAASLKLWLVLQLARQLGAQRAAANTRPG